PASFLAGGQVPEADRAFAVRRGSQRFAVRREGEGKDLVAVPLEPAQLLAGGRVQETNGAVPVIPEPAPAGRGQYRVVRTNDRGAMLFPGLGGNRAELSAVGHVPEINPPSTPAGGQPTGGQHLAVVGKNEARRGVAVGAHVVGFLAGGLVPQPDGAVAGR